jgi:thiosulfate reductase cytochrome b subunit
MEETLTLSSAPAGPLYRRHALAVRVLHWVNVAALAILLMSGLSIFNAHPRLYWGKSSYTGRPPILEMAPKQVSDSEVIGVTRVFGREFDTTGVLGVSRNAGSGQMAARGFPHWLTIPDDQWLSMARSWHFFFAWVLVLNGIAYVAYSIASRHLSRDLAPTRGDLRSIGREVVEHVRFRHRPSTHYNVLQKLAYLFVVFVLVPLMIVAGLAMSPWLDTLFPGWVDLLGGRQSARTVHFALAWLIVGFVAIHVFMVIATGVWNNVRSMITGNYRVSPGSEGRR